MRSWAIPYRDILLSIGGYVVQIVDFSAAPEHPLERLMWLSGVMEEAKTELDREYQRTYFQARTQGMLKDAVALGIHSRKSVLAYTRHENSALGVPIRRWDD
jgi:hypothetical protein